MFFISNIHGQGNLINNGDFESFNEYKHNNKTRIYPTNWNLTEHLEPYIDYIQNSYKYICTTCGNIVEYQKVDHYPKPYSGNAYAIFVLEESSALAKDNQTSLVSLDNIKEAGLYKVSFQIINDPESDKPSNNINLHFRNKNTVKSEVSVSLSLSNISKKEWNKLEAYVWLNPSDYNLEIYNGKKQTKDTRYWKSSYLIDDFKLIKTELESSTYSNGIKKNIRYVVGDINFNSGSHSLTPKGNELLQKLYLDIQSLEYSEILIIGYTDNIGESESNLLLSKQRASRVALTLRSKGIDLNKLKYFGKGDSQPIMSNDTEDGRKKNRRVEIIIY